MCNPVAVVPAVANLVAGRNRIGYGVPLQNKVMGWDDDDGTPGNTKPSKATYGDHWVTTNEDFYVGAPQYDKYRTDLPQNYEAGGVYANQAKPSSTTQPSPKNVPTPTPKPSPQPQPQKSPSSKAEYRTDWVLGVGPVKIPLNDQARIESSASRSAPASLPRNANQPAVNTVYETVEVPGKKEAVKHGTAPLLIPEGTKRSQKVGSTKGKKKGLNRFNNEPLQPEVGSIGGMGSASGLNIPV